MLLVTLLTACGDGPADTAAGSTGNGSTGALETSTTTPTTQPDTTADTTAPDPTTTAGSTGPDPSTSSSTEPATDTGIVQACVPDSELPCYGGPNGTAGVGLCQAGVRVCLPDGTGYGACAGQVLPADEICDNLSDEDCDGTVNEADAGCTCDLGEQLPCYEGPNGTEGVGVCAGGTRTCDGTEFGPCEGQTLPSLETCDTLLDDDCDGEVNEPDAGCICDDGEVVPCYEGPPGTENVGVCIPGTRTCAGGDFGPCEGQVQPAVEACDTPADDDCDGDVNEPDAGCNCAPNTQAPCYSGPPGTDGVGPCHGGSQTCNAQGTGYGPCTGEVVPDAETCNTPADDDCDGMLNEEGVGCVCLPNSVVGCYTGPPNTDGVGVCMAGTKTCDAQGTAYGPCNGEVLPGNETCMNQLDDDCDGQVNESFMELCGTPGDDDCDGVANEGCPVVTFADIQPILQNKCGPCHTVQMSGGWTTNSYATTQLNSNNCAGKTKGGCMIVRIQNGSMPQGKGCTGNPALDAGKPACLTAAEQASIQAWIGGGQLP